MIESIKKRPIAWAIAVSLLLHLLVYLVLIPLWKYIDLFGLTTEARAEEPANLVLTFDDQPTKPREVVQTPESAKTNEPIPNADHLSDKNARAQNPDAPAEAPLGEAFSKGVFAHADAAPEPKSESNQTEQQQHDNEAEESNEEQKIPVEPFLFGANNFSREVLTGKKPPQLEGSPGRDNTDSRAPDLGSFSLNTYDWEFAPYMLWLREQVQKNIYPPPAFTHMGLISGQTRLRFRIYPDGTLQALRLIGYQGHKTLMETSVRAVQLSVPFRKLPNDFPEDYLEITALFEYTVQR